MARRENFWDKFWKDKNGDLVVWRRPNLPIIVFVVAAIVYALFQNDAFGKFFGWVAIIALVIWAIIEIFRGANYFRRLLGASVLLLIIVASVL